MLEFNALLRSCGFDDEEESAIVQRVSNRLLSAVKESVSSRPVASSRSEMSDADTKVESASSNSENEGGIEFSRVKSAIHSALSSMFAKKAKRRREYEIEKGEELANKKLKENETCTVCLDRKKSVAFNPCGHIVTCEQCCSNLRVETDGLKKCPMCKTAINSSIKIFY